MRKAGIALCLWGGQLLAGAAYAQEFPVKPIRIVVGPGPDIIARVFGQKFSEAWGHQTIVEQRPGGGGTIATEMVAKAPPDGYTLLLSSAAYTINAVLQPGPYDLVRDFASIALCATSPFILSVHPSVPAKSVKELITLAKSKPGQLVYSSSGNGTPPHLAGEMFKTMAKVDILHVPYKYATPALIDVVSGQVQIMFPIMSISLPQVQSGKLRGLGVSTRERTRLAPQIPTIAESGLPGYEIIGWNGLIAPAKTPGAVVNKLNAEIQRHLKTSELVQRLAQSSYDPTGDRNSPEQFTEFVRAEIVKFARLVKESGAKID
ncbi:MAG TPA: tripartite tricarboxylate transporter substrate binding protein [Burkholderiales bacterium]|nr:tripartite tricarboxylate transporter substrate binding protein [Burkholderiales bacterium]